MPNAIAYLVLALWPLVCLLMFRRLRFEQALIWSILGGYLILPQLTEFNLPLVPALDKASVPNLSAYLICVFVLRRKVALWPASLAGRALIAAFVLGAIPTVLTNAEPIVFHVLAGSEPIIYKIGEVPGQGWRDVFSFMLAQALVLLPFLLARQYLATREGMRDIMVALLGAGLVYSLPALFEVRFSPQLHIWVYGFFQHDFAQMMREGGFRPIVFLPHGLWAAMFFLMTLLAAAGLYRAAPPDKRLKSLLFVGYLGVVLLTCKSWASLGYATLLVPLILLTGARTQIRVAILLALIASTYPVLRGANLIPVQEIVAKVQEVNPDRAQSFGFRINNENLLLARAQEKPLFGWSGWGRNLILNGETGEIETIPDGRWIIVLGTYGWLGYIAEFGLLTLPLLLLGWRTRAIDAAALPADAAVLSLILAITMIDMLLNATLVPFTWLIAGAILGYAEALKPVPQLRPLAMEPARRHAKSPRTIL